MNHLQQKFSSSSSLDLDIFLNALLRREKDFNESYFLFLKSKRGSSKRNSIPYPLNDLYSVLKEFEGDKDIYITPNGFATPNERASSFIVEKLSHRTKENVRVLKNIFLDLDLKSTEYSVEEAYYEVLRLAKEKVIPYPSIIVCSGRGLHVYWNIGSYKATEGLKSYYIKITKSMAERLKHLGADSSKFEDYSAILRVPNTTNSKDNSRCYLVEANNLAYTLKDLKENYFKNDYRFRPKPPNERNFKVIKGEKNVIESETIKPKLEVAKTYNTLHYGVFKDIEKLLEIRCYDTTNRGNLLFILAYYKCLVDDGSIEMYDYIENINYKLSNPKSMKKVLELCKSAEKYYLKNAKLKYTSKRIIEALDITEEEQLKLKILINKDIKADRKNDKRKLSRRNEEGLTKREQNKKDTYESIQALKSKGLSQSKVAKQLGVGIATVKRHWKQII